MSENQVAETTADVVETTGADKQVLVAAGVTILVATAVGVALKLRARRTETVEVVVDGETYNVPVKALKPKTTPES
jgi:hypothetical protein